jgi:hypothetical protein
MIDAVLGDRLMIDDTGCAGGPIDDKGCAGGPIDDKGCAGGPIDDDLRPILYRISGAVQGAGLGRRVHLLT